MRVIGIDGCKAGWICVAIEDGRLRQFKYVPDAFVLAHKIVWNNFE